MSILYSILTTLLVVTIIVFLGIQFCKLGSEIKSRFPIAYRLYVVFWSLLLIFVLATGWIQIGSFIEQNEKQDRIDQALVAIQNKPKFTKDNKLILTNELKSDGYTDKEIFEALNKSDQFKKKFEEARLKHNASNYDIAKEFGLSPY